ncbi:hypothetical protein E4U42_004548 [Claviceps africana]|uniref:Chromo domain-containing protein n=1 Tax=Claviceps africana TaxID=83212 RepID=A0A8K0J639_9HYPO|nr:hypothetical protein E4U42_004548 [Claviceps africana]
MTDDSTDDSDSFTLSSTSEDSDSHSQAEFFVEKILAEAKVAGVQKYLIEWTNFPLCDATWEPAEHLSQELLSEWREAVEETGRTTLPGFKISNWRKAVNTDIRARYAKHEEKNKKRALLGLKKKDLKCSLQEWLDSIEGPSEDEDYDRHTKKNKIVFHQMATGEKETSATASAGTRLLKRSSDGHQQEPHASGTVKRFKASGSGISSTLKKSSPLAVSPMSSKETSNKGTKSPSNVSETPHSSKRVVARPEKGESTTSLSKASASKISGSAAPRSTLNVFVGGKQRKPRRNLLDIVSVPSESCKFFNYRQRWQVEKGQRDKEGIRPPTKSAASLTLMPIRARRESDADKALLDDGKNDTIPGQSGRSHLPASSCSTRKTVRWADDLEDESQGSADALESLFMSDGEEAPEEPKIEPLSPSQEDKVVASACSSSADGIASPFLSVAENTSKICQFGPSSENSVRLRFSGWLTDDKSTWSCHLQNQSHLRFSHMCTMQDLKSPTEHAKLDDVIVRRGNIEANDESKSFLELLAKRLQVGQLAFVCLLDDKLPISIVIHVPEAPLAGSAPSIDSQSVAEPAQLQYFIFLPHPPVSELMLAPLPPVAKQNERDLRIYQFFLGDTFEKHFKNSTTEGTTQNFFLVFPPSAHQEAIMVCQWLRESDSSCTIKTSLIPGQWAEFVSRERGNVIFHEAAIWVMRSMPQLGAILHSQVVKMYFWKLSRSSLLSKGNDLAPAPTDYRLRQILRSGTIFLVTPSFLVSQPEQAYNFIKFFWKSYTSNSPIFRLGKLAVASDISCWLAELAIEKAQSWSLLGESDARDVNGHKASEALRKCYTLLRNIIDDTEDAGDSPLLYAPDVLDGNDEQSLVNWFGSWTVSHNQQFRKFYVVGSSNQSETRLSRNLQPVQFLSTVEHDVDLHSIPNEDRMGPSPPLDGPPSDLMKIRKSLTDSERVYKSPPFNPIVLYRFPIIKTQSDIISERMELDTFPDEFDRWHSFFADPLFGNIFNIKTKGQLRSSKNTFVGFFYTRDLDQLPKFGTDPRQMIWSPWIAIYRPSDIHCKAWKSMELLIWDPAAATRVPEQGGPYEEDLLWSQRQLVHLIEQKTRDRNDALPLGRVWLGPFDDHPAYSREANVDNVYRALRCIEDFPSSYKHSLPTNGKFLISRGWKQLSPGSRPAPEVMDLDAPRSESLPLRAILQPPGSGTNPQEAPCRNHFRDAISGHRGTGPISFTFQPTLKWYTPQFDMGLGFQHIVVSKWQSIFERYGIHDPEKE